MVDELDDERIFESFGYLENILEEDVESVVKYRDYLHNSEDERSLRPPSNNSSTSESSFSSFYLDDRSASANSSQCSSSQGRTSRATSSRGLSSRGTSRDSSNNSYSYNSPNKAVHKNYRKTKGLGYQQQGSAIRETFSTKRHIRKHIDTMITRHKMWNYIRKIKDGSQSQTVEQQRNKTNSHEQKHSVSPLTQPLPENQQMLPEERTPIKLNVKKELIWSTKRDGWQKYPNPATKISSLELYAKKSKNQNCKTKPSAQHANSNMHENNKTLKFNDGNILQFSRQKAPRFPKSRLEIQERTRAFDTIDGTNSSALAARLASKQTWDKRSTSFGKSKSSRLLPRKVMSDMFLLTPPTMENGQHYSSYEDIYPINSFKLTVPVGQTFSKIFKFTSSDGREGIGPVKVHIDRQLEIREEKEKCNDPYNYIDNVKDFVTEKKIEENSNSTSRGVDFSTTNGREKPIGNRVSVKTGSQTGLFDINDNPGPGAYNVENIVRGTNDLPLTESQKQKRYKALLASGKCVNNYSEKRAKDLKNDMAMCKLAIGGVTTVHKIDSNKTNKRKNREKIGSFGGKSARFTTSSATLTSLVGVNGVPQLDDEKSWNQNLIYEKKFGGVGLSKSKERKLPWEKNLALSYIRKYKNFVPSPRGSALDNKVPMIRLMENSKQKYSYIFKSNTPARGKDFELARDKVNQYTTQKESNGLITQKIKSPPLSFDSSPPRPDPTIMLQSMGVDYKTQRPRFEPNAGIRGPAKFCKVARKPCKSKLKKWLSHTV